MPQITDPTEYVFVRRQSAATSAVLWMFFGVAALVLAAFGLTVAILASVSQLSLHVMTTLPTIMAFAAFATAWSVSRTPKQVAIGPEGITIDRGRTSDCYTWDQIGWSAVAMVGVNNRQQLRIYDTRGKAIASVNDTFDDFDTMANLVTSRVAMREDDTPDRIHASKVRRSALICTICGLFLMSIVVANIWMAYTEQRDARLLEEKGIEGTATIVRRFLAPNGVTPRLEYRIDTDDGRTATRNAEMLRPLWEALEGEETVEVFYVPDQPHISRLAFGEAIRKDMFTQPLAIYALCGLLTAVCLVILSVAAVNWTGRDIDFSLSPFQFQIKRVGVRQ